MKLGIIGLPQSGKFTIFSALTGARGEEGEQKTGRGDQRIGTVRVADDRIDFLAQIYKPKKTTYARVEYFLPTEISQGTPSGYDDSILNQVRVCDALIHVVRNFQGMDGIRPVPETDFWRLEEEMILNDLAIAEKRLERMELDRKKGNKPGEEEFTLVRSCMELLEDGRPIRVKPDLASAQVLRGFSFLTAKPRLVIVNNDDEDEAFPDWRKKPENTDLMVVRGRLEMEIAAMSPDEAKEFQAAYHIETTALDRVIKRSYELLHLISFFTVLHDEVRAWTIRKGAHAIEAAGAVHSDMQRGFIRAEVLSFAHLKQHGSFQEARKAGDVHLEGKDYAVNDGDIIQFRFNI